VGRTIGPIEWIEITGGEPSLHPDFKEISLNLREIFQAPSFMLVTNGFLFEREKKQLPLLLQYNSIFLTHYTDQFYTLNPNSGKPNTSAVTIIKEFLESEGYSGLQVIEMNSHKSMNVKVTNGTGCYHFHSNMIAYYEGILYGCCVSWSLPEKGTGVPLTREWRSELKNINLPCETCFLSKPQLSNSQKDSETRNLLNVLP
jgi:hypothetical protein